MFVPLVWLVLRGALLDWVGVEEISVAGCGFASATVSRVALAVGVGTADAVAVDEEVGEVDMWAQTSGGIYAGRSPGDTSISAAPFEP